MTISDPGRSQAYVWIWLPGATTPVVAGKLTRDGADILFNYGRSYLDREDAIPIEDVELPLVTGLIPLRGGLNMPNSIRDAAPDAWGRRVIMNKLLGTSGPGIDTSVIDELTYLLETGSDRTGALDFQVRPTGYIARRQPASTLDELGRAAEKVELGLPLTPELDQALLHGSSVGGARPKALIETDDRRFIAKFSSTSDVYNVVKAEYVAMRLAAIAGLKVAPVSLERSLGKDVLLIERFDRALGEAGWTRRHMVSALTLLELDEMTARYAGYETLAEIIRRRFREPSATLRELYSRMVFNVLCGNTDDHARNHAAFWDGRDMDLTPAYDICPQNRTGGAASQAMMIAGSNRMSQVAVCLDAAPAFRLTRDAARGIARGLAATIRDNWDAVCDEAGLSPVERAQSMHRQFLNPFSTIGLDDTN